VDCYSVRWHRHNDRHLCRHGVPMTTRGSRVQEDELEGMGEETRK